MHQVFNLSLAKLQTLILVLILLLAAGLRLYNLDHLPPSLYWEEAALGYDAFSILQTGKDHHGNSLPLVAFESFGDWKPSGYFYALVPVEAVLGLTPLAVRLPSALAGILTVLGVWALARLMVKEAAETDQPATHQLWLWYPLVAAGVTAISPWMIIFSRGGWEVNLATCFLVWGMVMGIRAVRSSGRSLGWWLACVLLLMASLYTYHTCRVLAPALGLGLIGYWWQSSPNQSRWWSSYWKHLVIMAGLSVVLLLPFIMAWGQPQLSQRFSETSIFSDLSLIEESNQRSAAGQGSLGARLSSHRYVLYGREIAQNYVAHFDLNFLFISGDSNARHSIQYLGQLYHVELLFLVVGVYFWCRRWQGLKALLSWWLLLGILPAALTTAVPHALRILPVVPVVMLVIGAGIVGSFEGGLHLIGQWQRRGGLKISPVTLSWLLVTVILLIYAMELTQFWRFYTRIYPKQYASDWQYGYSQLVSELQALRQEYPDLPFLVSREFGRQSM